MSTPKPDVSATAPDAAPIRPVVTGFSVKNYRAFEDASLKLGRLTILLGRNNAGKSALCFAPFYFAQVFRADKKAPLVSGANDMGFGSPQSAIHRRAPTGMEVCFDLTAAGTINQVHLGVTVQPEKGYAQQVTRFSIQESSKLAVDHQLVDWKVVRGEIKARPELLQLADEIGALRGVRPPPPRDYEQLGYAPEDVGVLGDQAAAMLLATKEPGLETVNKWFQKIQAKLSIKKSKDHFEVLAQGTSGEPVNLVSSGAGVAQLLPLVVQLCLAERLPRLWCVEQPELHLHPAAHPVIAELFLDRMARDPEARFLIETHSDAFVLRIRRELALGHLKPADVRIYFVDETSKDTGGSIVTEIPLTEEGTPTWWPEGVFAEPEREFFKIRQALQGMRHRPELG